MGFLGALSGVVGLLGGAAQSRAGGNLVNRGQGQIDEAINNAGNTYRDAKKLIQDRQASGAYNAAQALQLLGEQAAHALDIKDKNTASQLATLGYKRGDSPFTQQSRLNSEAANFQLRQDLLNTSNMYDQKYNNDFNMMSNYGQQYNNMLSGAGQQNISRGEQMQAAANSGISSLVSGGLFNSKNWNWLKGS